MEKDFKKFVLEKHGKLRGKLGEEMEKALSFYLTHQEKTDTQDATTNAQLEKQLESPQTHFPSNWFYGFIMIANYILEKYHLIESK